MLFQSMLVRSPAICCSQLTTVVSTADCVHTEITELTLSDDHGANVFRIAKSDEFCGLVRSCETIPAPLPLESNE